MSDDFSKTVIRIIQDCCFESSAPILSDKFALTLTPRLIPMINDKTLNLPTLLAEAGKRKDFFIANDLEVAPFCKVLFKKLEYELSFYQEESFSDMLLQFKRKMENGNFRGFPKKSTSEDTLRSTLVMYLQRETFCEARAAAGNSDIVVPSEKVVIETKLWNGFEYYRSGFPELNEYLEKYGYNEGYYLIFDYNRGLNEVIQKRGMAFDEKYNGNLIHILFIRMNEERPSQKYKASKKKP